MTPHSRYFKIQDQNFYHYTILNYLKFCADSFLIYKITHYDLERKNIQNIDKILKNIVCLEPLCMNFKVFVGKRISVKSILLQKETVQKSMFR